MTCTHQWIIESPSGKTCKGVCSVCGAESEFNSSMGDEYASKGRHHHVSTKERAYINNTNLRPFVSPYIQPEYAQGNLHE